MLFQTTIGMLAAAAGLASADNVRGGPHAQRPDTAARDLQVIITPTPPDFRADFYSLQQCAPEGGRTTILAQQGYCQRVIGADANYKVQCSADGAGGAIAFCSDYPTCGSCGISTPFTSGQCVRNVGPGSQSLTLTCLPTNSTPPPNLECNRCQITYFVGRRDGECS